MREFIRNDIQDNDYVKSIAFYIKPEDNDGEAISIEVDVFNNDLKVFTTTHIHVYRNGNKTTKTSVAGIAKIIEAMQVILPYINVDENLRIMNNILNVQVGEIQ